MAQFNLTEEQFIELSENGGGFCVNCGAEASGVEPDARRYQCENCGERYVYGAEELLIMGKIDIA